MTARSKSYVCSIAQACQTINTYARCEGGHRRSRDSDDQDWLASRPRAWIATCRSVVCHMSGMEAFKKAP
jgi:hypothetical protein